MDSRSLANSIFLPHPKTVKSPPFLQREINIHHITTLCLLPFTITCCTQLQTSATDPRHAQSVSRLSSPVRSDRALHLAKRLISLDPYQEIDRASFKSPNSSDRLLIESYLLQIQIAYRLSERIGFIGSGSYHFLSPEKNGPAASVRNFSVGWAFDFSGDTERWIVTDTEQIPMISRPNLSAADHVPDCRLDQIRRGNTFYESNAGIPYPVNETSRLNHKLDNLGIFFPQRAALSHPLDCWSGRAREHRSHFIDYRKLVGIQKISDRIIALFHFRPSKHYDFFVTACFREGLPVQVDFWRLPLSRRTAEMRVRFGSRGDGDHSISSTTESSIAEIKSNAFKAATHVAVTRSAWAPVAHSYFPVSVQSRTIQEIHEIALNVKFQWLVGEDLNPSTFDHTSCSKLLPNGIAKSPFSR